MSAWPYYIVKVLVSALLVVAISEVAKRSSFWGAALASIPLTSVLAMVWLQVETGNTARIASPSRSILWLVIPSRVLFLALPGLLRLGWGFWPSLLASIAATSVAYGAMGWLLGRLGVQA